MKEFELAAAIDRDRIERRIVASLAPACPAPERLAPMLPVSAAEALAGARLCEGTWMVSPAQAASIRPYGLCDARTPYLSAYGCKVRRVLTEWSEAE